MRSPFSVYTDILLFEQYVKFINFIRTSNPLYIKFWRESHAIFCKRPINIIRYRVFLRIIINMPKLISSFFL